MRILEQNDKIFTVWLRQYGDTSLHPVIVNNHPNSTYNIMHPNFSYIDKGKQYTWHGITFNPGLRRTDVCMKLHPYCKIEGDPSGEYKVNHEYGKLGYFAAITKRPEGFVKHIGWNDHIERPLK
jgi:hypothetical protein